MCNEIRRTIALGEVRDDFAQLRIPLRFPEGLPNLGPAESVRITDRTAIVRAAMGEEPALVQRRWSWPGAHGKPVYNYRSEGRRFDNAETSGRCLVIADGFYEYTAAEAGQRLKTKWLFTARGVSWFAIAGLWRTDPAVGEAFTMLTTAPGEDIAPYHDRQIVILPRDRWAGWLDGSGRALDLCRPLPPGSLAVERVR